MFGQLASPFQCPVCGAAPTVRINEEHGREVAGCEVCGRIHTAEPAELPPELETTIDSKHDNHS